MPLPIPTSPPTLACDGCHRELASGASYQRLTLGLNDEIAGAAPGRGPTVEEMTELTFCHRCSVSVGERVDTLLSALWELRSEPPHLQVVS